MMKNLHFIVAGDEDTELHLAGLHKFKTDEAVVFSSNGQKNPLFEILSSTGTPYTVVNVEPTYFDSYKKVSYEAASAFTRTACVGINMSTGPDISRTAMEDAVRVQLYHFLHHTSKEEISAFKYFVRRDGNQLVMAAPIWDFATYLHNDIFETLATAQRPITLAQLYKATIKTMGREAPKWEAFRKTFREFKRCFKESPCFVEIVGKGPRYQIRV